MGKHPTALRLKGYQDWVTSQFLFQSRHNKYCDQKCDVKPYGVMRPVNSLGKENGVYRRATHTALPYHSVRQP
jgi:hypothetical protein